jgi:filamentous hemagglutinin
MATGQTLGRSRKTPLICLTRLCRGGDGVRYAIDSNGNINRFFSDGNGVYHWSGATGDSAEPLNVSKIPIDVKRALGFKGK